MVYLVRQGQTDWNLFRRFNGVTETFLNQNGIEQARKQAEELKDIDFDICFCSPQKRAIQTEENGESMHLFWQAVQIGDKGTESFDTFMKRNASFCNMLEKDCMEKNVLIITHAANARIINYYLSGKPENYDFTKAVAQDGEILKY